MKKRTKRLLGFMLTIALCLSTSLAVLAKEPLDETTSISEENTVLEFEVTSRGISGYGEGKECRSVDSFPVPVVGTSGGGYGITIVTEKPGVSGGTIFVELEKPDGSYCNLGGSLAGIFMSANEERKFNFSNVQTGTYKLHYTVVSPDT